MKYKSIIKQLIKIERESNKKPKLKEQLEIYINKVGEPKTKQDAYDFIAEYNIIKETL